MLRLITISLLISASLQAPLGSDLDNGGVIVKYDGQQILDWGNLGDRVSDPSMLESLKSAISNSAWQVSPTGDSPQIQPTQPSIQPIDGSTLAPLIGGSDASTPFLGLGATESNPPGEIVAVDPSQPLIPDAQTQPFPVNKRQVIDAVPLDSGASQTVSPNTGVVEESAGASTPLTLLESDSSISPIPLIGLASESIAIDSNTANPLIGDGMTAPGVPLQYEQSQPDLSPQSNIESAMPDPWGADEEFWRRNDLLNFNVAFDWVTVPPIVD